ncbi:MAG: Abi family protein [Bacteroidales bacterium]|nr:Abi family protein [Bacteroidales bacterium]
MSKVPYSKTALTYEDQLRQLKLRGLIVEDQQKALHLLEVISYYRLSGYWYPLLSDKLNHRFKQNATFEAAFSIYKFDRELRLLVLRELEKIEVAIRAKMIYILSHRLTPFWYLDSSNFLSQHKHSSALEKMKAEYHRSDEEFVQSFRNKYSDPMPPSWMMFEVSSFGTLSTLYSNLKVFREKREIAKYFGLSDVVFSSWLHSIVYLRNICAHHTRLWNREMQIQPAIPRNSSRPFIKYLNEIPTETGHSMLLNNKVYFFLSMIIYLMESINLNHAIPGKFKALLAKYPNIDTQAMGFPVAWQKENLWK